MKKILLVSDSPYASTGLARMSKYFLKMLPEFEWSVWGFLHPNFVVRKGKWFPEYGEKDFGETKFKLLTPRMFTDDQYGLDFVPDFIAQEKPDFLITSMDYDRILKINEQIKQLQFTMDFKWINYFPMDREDFKRLEVDSFRFPDINVCITKFGVEQIRKYNPKVADTIKQIYHPLDVTEFPMINKKEARDFKLKIWPDISKDTFVVSSINRSFARKDTPRLIVILSEFLKKSKNSFAYVHGSRHTFERLDLARLAYESEAPQGKLSFMPDNLSEIDGLSQDLLNKLYQAMDLFVTVSCGEGFGFSTVEALLTETPIIAPANTSFPELVQDFGYLIPTKGNVFHHNGNSSMWPYVDVDEVVDKMLYVVDNYKEAKEKAKAGSQWVKDNLNFKVIGDQWREILK